VRRARSSCRYVKKGTITTRWKLLPILGLWVVFPEKLWRKLLQIQRGHSSHQKSQFEVEYSFERYFNLLAQSITVSGWHFKSISFL